MAYRMGRWGSRGADASDRFIPSQSQRKRRRRLAFVPAYLCVTGATAWCLTSLVYIGGYQRPVRDLGFGRQSQASVGEDLATALTGGNLTVLDDAGQAARPSVNKTISPAPSQGIPPHPWDPFIIDPAPLIALTSRPCYFPPWTFTALCSPPETPSEIAKYGHWIRVPRDIGRKVSTTYQELYYRRSPLARSPYAITAVKVFDATQLSDPDLLAELEKGQWERASGNIRSDIWPGHKKMDAAYLFVTRAKEVDGKQVDPINEIDVIWGDEKETKPWWGFERIGGTPIYGGSNDPDHVRTEITIRRTTVDPIPKKPDLTFKSDGTFKILQIADLHFSTDKGGCRESELLSTCEEQGADATTVFWLNQLIRKERPDLVVLSGDQLNGQKTSWDQFSVLLKVGHLVGDTQTPWTAIFGNHDSEDEGLGRGQQMLIMKSMPYFVGDLGPTDDDKMGVGNYMLPIRRGSEQDEQIFALFFLDSHAYVEQTGVASFWNSINGKHPTEYDFIKPAQIDWFVKVASSVPPLLRPIQPASLDDSTFGLWGAEEPSNATDPARFVRRPRAPMRARARRQLEAPAKQSLRRPNAILFQHIPLPEAYAEPDADQPRYGNQFEGEGSPKQNSGFFEKGILKVTEQGDGGEDDAKEGGQMQFQGPPMVKVVAHGHCHITDNCHRIRGVWSCFAGGSSYAGYGKPSFERRTRVFSLEDWGETIKTWKVLDPRVIAGSARPGGSADRKDRWEEATLVGVGA